MLESLDDPCIVKVLARGVDGQSENENESEEMHGIRGRQSSGRIHTLR